MKNIFLSNFFLLQNNLNSTFFLKNKLKTGKILKFNSNFFLINELKNKNEKIKLNLKNIRNILSRFTFRNHIFTAHLSFFNILFDINFLKKEKIYTKLKYSRVPQYDIVSGASAALLAGFLGFLICEKFGFELLDSGDFYFLFMYLVFLSFSLRLFVKLFSKDLNN